MKRVNIADYCRCLRHNLWSQGKEDKQRKTASTQNKLATIDNFRNRVASTVILTGFSLQINPSVQPDVRITNGIVGTIVVLKNDIKVAPKLETVRNPLEGMRTNISWRVSMLESKYPKNYISFFKVCVNSLNIGKALNPSLWLAGAYVARF